MPLPNEFTFHYANGRLGTFHESTLTWIVLDETAAAAATPDMVNVEDVIGVGGANELARGDIDVIVELDGNRKLLKRDPASTPTADLDGVTPAAVVLVDPESGSTDADRKLLYFLPYPEPLEPGYDAWPITAAAFAASRPEADVVEAAAVSDVDVAITASVPFFDPDLAAATWEFVADQSGITDGTRDQISMAIEASYGATGSVVEDQADVNNNAQIMAALGLVQSASARDGVARLLAQFGRGGSGRTILDWAAAILLGSPVDGQFSYYSHPGVDEDIFPDGFFLDCELALLAAQRGVFIEIMTRFFNDPVDNIDQDGLEAALEVQDIIASYLEACTSTTTPEVAQGEDTDLRTSIATGDADVPKPYSAARWEVLRLGFHIDYGPGWSVKLYGEVIDRDDPDLEGVNGVDWRLLGSKSGSGTKDIGHVIWPFLIGYFTRAQAAFRFVRAYNGLTGTTLGDQVLGWNADDVDTETMEIIDEVTGETWSPVTVGGAPAPRLVDFSLDGWFATGGAGSVASVAGLTGTVSASALKTALAIAAADVSGVATPADITSAINAVINAAPGALDTLDELAAALGDDANFASTVTTALAGKQASSAVLSSLVSNGTPGAKGLALLLAADTAAALAVLGRGTARVTSDQSVASTTVADTTGLSFSVTNGVPTYFRGILWVTGAASTDGDLRLAITHPGASTFYASVTGYVASLGGSNGAQQTSGTITASGTDLTGIGAYSTAVPIYVDGLIVPSATGTVQVRHGQNTSSATATVVKAGSYIEWWT